jgi:hypothetical protein
MKFRWIKDKPLKDIVEKMRENGVPAYLYKDTIEVKWGILTKKDNKKSILFIWDASGKISDLA